MMETLSEIELIPIEKIPAVIIALAARLLAAARPETDHDGDTLLSIDEAAARLGTSKDWLYRRVDRLPFVVRLGRNVRFSSQGIQSYVKQRRGRTAPSPA